MKKCLLCMVIILVTGCTANYNLKIGNDYIDEQLSLSIPTDLTQDDIFKSQTSSKISVYTNSNDKYDMSSEEIGGNHIINYSYRHNIDKFGKSNFIVKCFSKSDISESNDTIKFETGKGFNCIKLEDDAYLDEVKLNITTDLHVSKNNADEVNGKTYTWIFNDDNYKDKQISMELKKDFSLSDALNNNIWMVLIFIVLFVLVGGYFGYRFIVNKMNSSNEF